MNASKPSLALTMLCVLSMLVPATVVVSQGSSPWIYSIGQGSGAYQLSRTNGAQSEPLFSVPSVADMSFADLVTGHELERTVADLTRIGYTNDQITSFTQNAPDTTIEGISVAPDNDTVALNIRFQACTSFQSFHCFGTNRIILFASSSRTHQVVFDLPLTETDTRIGRIEWTADQTALVLEVSTAAERLNSADVNLIAVSLLGHIPIEIGRGYIWAVSPNSQQIAMITGPYTQPTLFLSNFDLASGQAFQTPYSLGTYVPLYSFGMAYVDERIVFQINHNNALLEGGGGTAVYSPNTANPLELYTFAVNGVTRIEATSDGQYAIIQSRDGFLWNVIASGNTVSLVQLTSQPVEFWDLLTTGEVLVQPLYQDSLQVLSEQGELLNSISFEGLTSPESLNTQGNALVDG